jgi:RND family efflux transporter MFP subunit
MTRGLTLVWLIVIGVACSSSKSDSPQAGVGGRRGGTGGGKLEYPVDVAPLVSRSMQYTVTAPGTIDAFQQVQITARVAGAVDKVTFAEGQQVKQGDVLATIESDRYAIAVEQARAAQAKATAAQKSAEAALERRLAAQKESPGLVPGEEIEQKQTAVDTAKADVLAAQQALRVAQLNLRDSAVRAPIAGIVQTRQVQQGQYLQPGAVLATILQRDPMLLRFQVTEQDAPRLQVGMAVNLQLKESPRTFTAKIMLVGGAADATTRMVPITAQVDETEHQYWLRPGAFCEVTVPVGTARPGIVVPSLAVQPTEKGNIVYIVDQTANVVHARVVQLGMHTSDGGVELTRGVTAGDVMVIRGIDPLTDGAPVKIGAKLTLEDAAKQATESGSGSAATADPSSAGGGGSADPGAGGAGSGSGSAHRGHHGSAP